MDTVVNRLCIGLHRSKSIEYSAPVPPGSMIEASSPLESQSASLGPEDWVPAGSAAEAGSLVGQLPAFLGISGCC